MYVFIPYMLNIFLWRRNFSETSFRPFLYPQSVPISSFLPDHNEMLQPYVKGIEASHFVDRWLLH